MSLQRTMSKTSIITAALPSVASAAAIFNNPAGTNTVVCLNTGPDRDWETFV